MVANRLCAARSNWALPEWVGSEVVMPGEFRVPSAHHYYRALDVVAEAKEATETHLYGVLTDLTNLDLRLVCYDLTSTCFEGAIKPSARLASRAFGYSRDHRGDRRAALHRGHVARAAVARHGAHGGARRSHVGRAAGPGASSGAGRLKDKAKIAAAASRILSASGVARLFDVEIGEGRFLYHYDEAALHYDERLLAGR